MDGHFRAFSFVDRVISVQPGVTIRGKYEIPARLDSFPRMLVAEAIGQLAAWAGMAAVDFKRRPVAGIAGSVELLGNVRPGDTLELSADIETVDDDAMAYGGEARVAGVSVMRLNHCVGPMLPQEDFDDAQAVKERYELLCASGAAAGAFGDIPEFPLVDVTSEPGQWFRATLPIPTSAPFFADHFARRPVFPGTLFTQKVLEMAAEVARHIPLDRSGAAWVVREITDGKMRAFIPPGDSLQFEARLAKQSADTLVVLVEASKGKRTTGSSRIHFNPETTS